MKKIFLSLLVVFMVLSLTVVLVKAEGESSVTLTDGVQIRTDGNNGLRWEAKVENAEEGQVYGFLFAQGELSVEQLNKDTEGVIAKEVEELKEDGTYHATMVKFPTSAVVQEISVRAYVKTGEEYIYSENVVVRNLAEVAVEAYESGTTGDFVKAVYDASETTFVTGEGNLKGDYQIIVTNYETSTDGSCVGIERKNNKNTAMGKFWYRVALKYNEEVKTYQVVATYDSGTESSSYLDDYDYMVGVYESNNKNDETEIRKILNLEDPTLLFVDFDIPEETGNCNIALNFFYDVELTNYSDHLGGGEALPKAYKDYYDFVGWYNNQELDGEAIVEQGKDRTLYAKFTPTNYKITFEIGGGSWVDGYIPVSTYNYESDEIILPTSENITIEGGKFYGWYDNSTGEGDAITKISTKSYGDITLYAIWEMDEAVKVELTSGDINALSLYTPTKFVNSSFTAGKFIINGVEYDIEDGSLFATIDLALAAAVDNDIIYVFANGARDTMTNSTSNVEKITIVGPNAGVSGNSENRENEAILYLNNYYINTPYIAFDGVEIQGGLGHSIRTQCQTNVIIKNSVLTGINSVIRLESGSSNIEASIIDSKLDNVTQFILKGDNGLKTFNFIGNYISNYGSTDNTGAGMIRSVKGNSDAIVNIYNNYFDGDPSNNIALFRSNIGTFNVKYNTFKGVTKYLSTGTLSTTPVTFNCNLYLDAEGNVLNAAPSNVSSTTGVADRSVCSSESDRAARYQEFLNGAIPTYKVTYELNGGSVASDLVTSFEKYIGLSELPEPTKDNYTFLGWTLESDSTEYVTSISASTYNDVTLYAQWKEGEVAPIVVELTEADLAALESLNATKVVNPSFESGKYSINEVVYKYGESAFATISAALSAATENDVIYIFAGTYDESLTISQSNLSIYGPNYGIEGTKTRNAEAIISSLILNASNIHIEGVKTTATKGIQIKGGSSITIMNSICTGSQTASTQAVVEILASISNLTIKNCLIESLNNTANYYRGIFADGYVVTNATIENNTIKNDAPNSLYTDAVRFNNVSGEINIKNNFIDWGGNNYTLFFGSGSIAANTTINILHNTFDMTNKGSGMAIRNINSTTVVNIKNNSFDNVGGTMINVRGSSSSDTTTVAEVNICNNALLNISTNISIQLSSENVVMDNNYFFQDVNFIAVKATITNPAVDAETALNGE